MLADIGKILIAFGLVLVILGLFLVLVPGSRLGRLPGDIVIQRERWNLYVPIMSSVLLSVFLTLLFWIISWLRR